MTYRSKFSWATINPAMRPARSWRNWPPTTQIRSRIFDTSVGWARDQVIVVRVPENPNVPRRMSAGAVAQLSTFNWGGAAVTDSSGNSGSPQDLADFDSADDMVDEWGRQSFPASDPPSNW